MFPAPDKNKFFEMPHATQKIFPRNCFVTYWKAAGGRGEAGEDVCSELPQEAARRVTCTVLHVALGLREGPMCGFELGRQWS
jgi:hypothetical protein